MNTRGVDQWHPYSHKFTDPTIAQVVAAQAIREGDLLREKLRNHRILESNPGNSHEREDHHLS